MTQSNSWKKATTTLSLLILGGGLALGGNQLINSPRSFANESQPTAQAETDLQTQNAIAVPPNYVSSVVQQVGDSVVRIDASRTVATRPSPVLNDPFFRQFFG